ncbi:MAG TPA: Gfo/Idh/MocA family oxidoreductase [Armatimonadota bacterium]|nr:Gfo/Idh/MocA family oxidoreductase [Armatimonadota bacterium]
MADRVNVGFIGCGGNARGHMKRLMELPDAKLVAVCDVVEELTGAAAGETGAEAYTDHRRLLDRPDLQAVYISIPVFAHGQPEFDVIERGLPFLVEKPVAIDMPTAREIEARVRERGLMTAVGYQLRYGGTVDLARELLAGQRLGLVTGQYWCNSGVGDPTRWLRQMGKSGGQLVEQATHTIDMMRYLAGEVTELYCAGTRQVLTEIDCPDFSAVTLKFESGAVGSLTTSWAYGQGWNNTNVVDILFEDARLNWTFGKLTVYRDGKTDEHTPPAPGIDEIFINAVKTGDGSAIRSPYPDAVRSLALSLAMNRSAAESRPVAIGEIG